MSALLDIDLANPHPPLPAKNWFVRLWDRVKTPSRWKEIAYLLVKLPIAVITFSVTSIVWAFSFALLVLPFYVHALPGDTAEFGLFDVGSGVSVFVAAFVGLLGVLFLAPWTTVAFAALDGLVARWLFGPSHSDRHRAEMARVEASRAAAVDSADDERRRIERNLHDGAQARLVAVAMDLGRAEQHFDEDPVRARAARRRCASGDEGRALRAARPRAGLPAGHPRRPRPRRRALGDRRARPVPVDIKVDISQRPPAPVENAAYYVVVEALANVAKHSGATKASVSIARRGDRLAIDVTDNGEGGADATRGTGLQGLEERVRGLGGWMQVLSPAGGPTSIIVELPCAS